MATKHTHQLIFGRREPGCPRCAELNAGAAPIQWRASRAQQDARHAADVRAHFTSHKHLSGGCGPVCTFGEW